MSTTMTRRTFAGFLAGAAVAAAAATRGALAHNDEEHGTPKAEDHSGGMTEHGAGTPAMGSAPMGGTGAAFMTIKNTGSEDDRLAAVKTPVAQTSEIHEMKHEGDVMKMSPMEHGLELPHGETVELKPGGYHVMLIGLTEDLLAGKTFELTLTFEHAGDVTLTVPVRTQAEQAKVTPEAAIKVGDLEITGVWSRPAPAMLAPEASPAATPSM